MAAFDVLQVRDLVALFTIVANIVAGRDGESADDVVRRAFEIADAFVEQSTSRWAQQARTGTRSGPEEPPQK